MNSWESSDDFKLVPKKPLWEEQCIDIGLLWALRNKNFRREPGFCKKQAEKHTCLTGSTKNMSPGRVPAPEPTIVTCFYEHEKDARGVLQDPRDAG